MTFMKLQHCECAIMAVHF